MDVRVRFGGEVGCVGGLQFNGKGSRKDGDSFK
jgi:hypothetical protein